MKRLVCAAIALTSLVLASPAWAKGPVPLEASISGPGLRDPITFSDPDGPMGTNASSDSRGLSLLTEQTAFWESVYMDDRQAGSRPDGDLGPRYTITWVVGMPGIEGLEPQTVVTHVYPYAQGGPVVFTPGQRLDFGGRGPISSRITPLWKATPDVLADNLQGWGIPTLDELRPGEPAPAPASETAPENEPAATPSASVGPWLVLLVGVGSLAAAALVAKRRPLT